MLATLLRVGLFRRPLDPFPNPAFQARSLGKGLAGDLAVTGHPAVLACEWLRAGYLRTGVLGFTASAPWAQAR